MGKYTELQKQQMKSQAIRRLAEIFYDHFEEGRVGSSRIFEHIVPDEWIIRGQSNGGENREHVVPCARIRNDCIKMYTEGKSKEEVASMIERHLWIVLITKQEADKLNRELGWQNDMPAEWQYENGDPFFRLHEAGIVFS